MRLRRREALWTLATLAAYASLPRAALAVPEPLLLHWEDLVPGAANSGAGPGNAGGGSGGSAATSALRGVVNHGEIQQSLPADAVSPALLRHDLNDRLIRLPGYALPLSFEEVGVTEFLLVPYIGACVHVPPPPANQIVLVTTAKPTVFRELFAAVWVTGTLQAEISSIETIDIGYRIAATDISEYQEPK
jgi:hypothetical protein